MWRAILFLMLGTFCSGLFVAAISVFVFHDVDQGQIGHLNEPFANLSIETVVFSLVISGLAWLLALLGRHLFHLRGYSPRARVGLYLGIAVTVFQYPFEFIGRILGPNLAESFRWFYLVAAILLCTAVLLRDTFNQRKLRKALEPTSTHL
jgi:cytochrome bd-type quinol oxidase subunit 2